jgi:polygalacturonase
MSRTILFLACALIARAAEYPVADFGARGDGRTVSTAAIQKAIDAAAPNRGTVTFQPGVYLSGALFVKSGVHLYLADGVVLRGVQDLAAYPVMQTRVAGVEMKWPSALLNVYEQTGVKISGKGAVDGDGKIWWDKYWKMRRQDYEPKGLRWAADYDCMRPRLIQVYRSSTVELEGLTLQRSGFWTVHICFSTKVTVDGIVIRNNIGGKGPSTDGIDIDSSADVLVRKCDIECNDDAICLKSGRDSDGLRVNRPSERVVIRDSTIRGGAAGVTIGSETSGGFRDIEVSGLTVLPNVPNGVLFKSANTRGGTIENIRISNIEMQGVARPISIQLNWNPSYSYAQIPDNYPNPPDYWRVLAAPVPPEKGLPHFRNVRVSGIHATGAQQAFSVAGYKDAPLRDFQFKDIDMEAKTAGSIQYAVDWVFSNLKLRTADNSRLTVKDSRNVTGLE